MSSNVLAEGTLYFDRQVEGVNQGIKQLLGVSKLEIKMNSELKEATSKDKGRYGQITASVAINKPADLSIALRQIDPEGLALAMQGSTSAYSQGAGTVTDEAVTAKKGTYVELSKRNIAAAGFAVTNTAGSTTYVQGTDYNVNYVMGFLEILAAGAITDAQALHVSFTHNAISGDTVLGGTVAQIKGRLFLDGVNLVDGKPLLITVHDATLTSDGAIDFMADDFSEISLKGRMATPVGQSAPYKIDYGLTLA